MTLGRKIILLLFFMGIVTAIVFIWFASHLFNQVSVFRTSVTKEQSALKAAQESSIKELQKKLKP